MNATLHLRRLPDLLVTLAFTLPFSAPAASQQLTSNTSEEIWRDRDRTTVDGKVLWVDGAGAVVFFNGSATNVAQAQHFKAAVGVGETDTGITTGEVDDVALAAIQGLNQELQDELNRRDAENAELKQRLAALGKIILSQRSN